ncbi:PREDICTED: 2-hydroxyisoflavanone dehydratase-like [Nicotiana attenuata]|uniref:2-hydroxyisoflavanone dehydratase n=1 Tax=Nicotiana attenuata TaxID=49451 RepID=A0A1J6JS78_NICAT|nr:PREDICTED: 2-hydroxyisoflavanone dehydratase-like [Nicotiana attenuata]OIT19380.1 2-hydroxyisoflavanone dehydratase [Nicotiana attenuata]
MASGDDVVVKEVDAYFRVYKSGRVERPYNVPGALYVPPSPENASAGVFSKDVTISPHVSARLYLPENTTAGQKLPVLVYYHGGGLVVQSAFFNGNHCYVNSLSSELNVIAVSVEYRLAPEVDVPTIYEDCWTALQWVASHAEDKSTVVNKDSWLTNHGNFSRVFLAGDSAGGNLVYHMTMRAGKENLNNEVKITGSIFAYPYFLFPNIDIDEEGQANKIWVNICPPLESGLVSPVDSPLINPLSEKAPSLSRLGCSRILVCMGKKDDIIPLGVGVRFVEGVKESGWDGELEYLEVDEGHAFQICKPETEEAKRMMKCYADFVHR